MLHPQQKPWPAPPEAVQPASPSGPPLLGGDPQPSLAGCDVSETAPCTWGHEGPHPHSSLWAACPVGAILTRKTSMMANLTCQLDQAMLPSFWPNTSIDIAVKVFF